MMDALNYLFIFEVAAFCTVVLGITWAIESAPAVARWLEYRKLRRQLRQARTEESIKAMGRMVRL